jgi:hypothetical protein
LEGGVGVAASLPPKWMFISCLALITFFRIITVVWLKRRLEAMDSGQKLEEIPLRFRLNKILKELQQNTLKMEMGYQTCCELSSEILKTYSR